MIFTGKVWTVGKRRTHLLIVEPATRILYKCGLKCKRRVAHFKHVANYGSKKDVVILKLDTFPLPNSRGSRLFINWTHDW